MTTQEAAEERIEDTQDDINEQDGVDIDNDNGDNDNNITVEERARAMGWIPKEEFRGDKERWVPAEEFIRKGEEELPVLKDTVRRLTKEVVESKKIFEKAHKFQEAAHKREIARIKKEKMEAVESGDTETYTRLEKEESDLMEDAPRPYTQEKEGLPQETKQEIDNWAAANPWFLNNKELNLEMTAAFGVIENMHPAADIPTKLKLAKERVARLHPDKFGNPNRSRPSAVEAGGQRNGKRTGKTYNDLPEEDKKMCDSFVRRGIMTRENYVKQYDWEEK